jgi:acetyl esterase/lipase
MQRFDVYIPPHAHDAPVIFMVHGGGWRLGDKESPAVVDNKMQHWTAKGFLFISVNNRLLPEATPLEQANDVALALAMAQRRAKEWGGDPAKFVLVGHSAGAHLVALVSASRTPSWRGSVFLDSAALDVPRIMEARHLPLYDEAFGANAAQWRAASPYHALHGPIAPVLAVCSSRRLLSCAQAHEFVRAAQSAGTKDASVLEENLSHREINETLGEDSAYTRAVDAFLARVLR